jgi:hypothetical protein
MTNTYCCVYSVETPDDGPQICLEHVEFFIKINLRNSASRLLLQEFIAVWYKFINFNTAADTVPQNEISNYL